jgi:thioredoxin reductase
MDNSYEVLIVGGGPAGLSAALALGRMLRSVLICDDGRLRNLASSHANNLPSQDGIHPAQWRENARNDLKKYETIHFFDGSVQSIEKNGKAFKATLSTGKVLAFRKVILAHGIKDKLPSTPGFQELWGKAVFHCPYCHGYEFRGKRLGFVGNGKLAEHVLPMLLGLSGEVIVFTNAKAELSPEFQGLMRKRSVHLIEGKITSLVHWDGTLQAVEIEGGTSVERDALLLGPTLPFEMKAPLGESLGCEKTEMGLYKVAELGKTTVPGVFAAGDIMTMLQSVLGAASLGQAAGAGTANELLIEDFAG